MNQWPQINLHKMCLTTLKCMLRYHFCWIQEQWHAKIGSKLNNIHNYMCCQWSVVKMSLIEFILRNPIKLDLLWIVILTQFSFLTRTGSKLGISPLMLAAMNGHVPAVKLLLDMGSDINAQIETNRNTALTLACFQGRAEVVSLLLDRKANVEHRAKVRSLGLIDHFMLTSSLLV